MKMTSAMVVETSVTTTDNSPFQDYSYLDNKTIWLKHTAHCLSLPSLPCLAFVLRPVVNAPSRLFLLFVSVCGTKKMQNHQGEGWLENFWSVIFVFI